MPAKAIDPDELAVGITAAKEVAATFTYMGVSVGDKVTDEDYTKLVTAILDRVNRYRAGSSI